MTTETKKITTLEEVSGALVRMEPQFKMALPPQINSDKFIRIVVTAVQMNPYLIAPDVNRTTLYNSCMKAAQDGLMLDGREATLTIFGKDVAYMPMVAGILKKVRNSGELSSITSQIVFKNDRFKYWVDSDGEHIEHEPLMFGDRGEAIGVYALAKTKDGAVYIEVMDKAQVMAVKAVSKAKSGPWAGSFEHEMWRKTVIRRLSKRLPMSTDLEQVITRDDELYDFDPKADEPKPEPKTRPTRLGKIIEATATPVQEEPPVMDEPPIQYEPEADIPINGKVVDGVIEDVSTKAGTTNGKAWTMYGCKIGGVWYTTFSGTHYEVIVAAKKSGATVRVAYLEEEKAGKTYRKLETVRPLAAEEQVPL